VVVLRGPDVTIGVVVTFVRGVASVGASVVEVAFGAIGVCTLAELLPPHEASRRANARVALTR